MMNKKLSHAEQLSTMLDKLGISVADLADEVHFSRHTIYRWMYGKNPFDLEAVKVAMKRIATRRYEEAMRWV